ncbi:Protein roadkill [Camponotus japonicus]
MNSIIEDIKIQHCQTQVKQDRFCYTWNIVDFWNIYKFKIDLYSSKAKNNFRFRMTPIENDDESTINFYGLIDNFEKNTKKTCYVNNYHKVNKANKNICYSILFKANEKEIAKISSRHIHMEPKNHYLLYPLPVSFLPLSDASSNMTLTVYFEFFIFVEVFDNNIYYSHKRLATKATDISIYEEKPDSLVTFLIDQERLEANKYLLCSKSKVFKAMFNDLKGSSNNEIQITDVGSDTLKELLFFVKTGYLPRSLENVNASVNVYELFIAAEKYDIQDLKLICQQHLIICTTVKNVLEHLQIAHLYNGKILAEYAKNFIKLYLKVLVGAEFVTLMQMYPELLTEIKKAK